MTLSYFEDRTLHAATLEAELVGGKSSGLIRKDIVNITQVFMNREIKSFAVFHQLFVVHFCVVFDHNRLPYLGDFHVDDNTEWNELVQE